MSKFRIIAIVLIGSIMLNTPLVLGFYYIITETVMKDFLLNVLILSSFMLLYWSYFVPFYKYYSARKLQRQCEFDLWHKASTLALVICPKGNFFEIFECWNKYKLIKYNKSIEKFS
jgi:hypothetical protein